MARDQEGGGVQGPPKTLGKRDETQDLTSDLFHPQNKQKQVPLFFFQIHHKS